MVLLKSPRELGTFVTPLARLMIYLIAQQVCEAGVATGSVFFADAEQQQASCARPPDFKPPEELDETEREELAVEVVDRLVQVGDREGDAGGPAVDLHERDDMRVGDELEVARHLAGLRLSGWDESPIVAPGLVVQLQYGAHFFVEAPHIRDADSDLGSRAQVVDHPSRALRHGLALPAPGVEVLHLRIPTTFHEAQIIRLSVRTEDQRRPIDDYHHTPQLAVDREVERPADALHATGAEPFFRGAKQGRRDCRVVLAFEEAKEPGAFVVIAVVLVVDLG